MKYEINDIVEVIRSNYFMGEPMEDVGYIGTVVRKGKGLYLIDFGEVLAFTHGDNNRYKEKTYRWYLPNEIKLVCDEISDIQEDEIAFLLRN